MFLNLMPRSSPTRRPSRSSPTRRQSRSPTRRQSRSPTRGWRSPHSQSKRASLRNRCGSKCFLMPNELKFPICNQSCHVSCAGVTSAKVRAAQWNYTNVYKRASTLVKKHKCTKASTRRKSTAKSPQKPTRRSSHRK